MQIGAGVETASKLANLGFMFVCICYTKHHSALCEAIGCIRLFNYKGFASAMHVTAQEKPSFLSFSAAQRACR